MSNAPFLYVIFSLLSLFTIRVFKTYISLVIFVSVLYKESLAIKILVSY